MLAVNNQVPLPGLGYGCWVFEIFLAEGFWHCLPFGVGSFQDGDRLFVRLNAGALIGIYEFCNPLLDDPPLVGVFVVQSEVWKVNLKGRKGVLDIFLLFDKLDVSVRSSSRVILWFCSFSHFRSC